MNFESQAAVAAVVAHHVVILVVFVECAPVGGQFERKDLTRPARLPEDGGHDEIPIPQCCIQAAGR